MDLNKKKFKVIKNVISKDFASFIYDYFLLKRQVNITLMDRHYFSPFETMFGVWNDDHIPNTYSHYADILTETLLLKLLPKVEKESGFKLNPNYSFFRIYKKGDILTRHKDRFSCEISITLNVGGDPWPIYIDPTGEDNVPSHQCFNKKEQPSIKPNAHKGIKVNLKPGDMLLYKGNELEHWRDSFDGENHGQIFLHYNNVKTKNSKQNIYDGRLHLGLPTVHGISLSSQYDLRNVDFDKKE
jgi:hypothetical protein